MDPNVLELIMNKSRSPLDGCAEINNQYSSQTFCCEQNVALMNINKRQT